MQRHGLGDVVEKALTSIGITKARVERWLGGECGCEDRRQKLNQLGWWAVSTARLGRDKAKKYLEEMLR